MKRWEITSEQILVLLKHYKGQWLEVELWIKAPFNAGKDHLSDYSFCWKNHRLYNRRSGENIERMSAKKFSIWYAGTIWVIRYK
jgi:hypothetical protein